VKLFLIALTLTVAAMFFAAIGRMLWWSVVKKSMLAGDHYVTIYAAWLNLPFLLCLLLIWGGVYTRGKWW
jgi:hypothetical protein